MKRLAVLLSMMAFIFGSYQLHAASSKGGAVAYWVCYAIRNKWSWWVILLIAAVGIGIYFDDTKKNEVKEKKQLENDHDEKGVK